MKKLIIFLIFIPILLQAHGVKHEVVKNKGIGLIVGYETGEPMVDAEVTIYSPKNYKKPYLTMTTDQQGCFMFLPNAPGKWAIVVSDNSGHGLHTTIEVDKNLKTDLTSTESANKTSLLQKVIMALCVIWGLMGTLLFYSRNKSSATKEK